MAERSTSDRIEILEKKVEELSALPARMSALTENVASLRTELLRSRAKSEDAHSETRALISQMYDLATKQAHDIRGELVDRFDGVDQRFDGVDQRFNGIDQRFDGIDQRFDGIDQRFDVLEATVVNGFDAMRKDLGAQLARIAARLALPPTASSDE